MSIPAYDVIKNFTLHTYLPTGSIYVHHSNEKHF